MKKAVKAHGKAELPKIDVDGLCLEMAYDHSINYAFQQNAIPVVKELLFRNDIVPRKNLVIRISTEPAFAMPEEIRLQGVEKNGEFRISPLNLKLSHDFLLGLNEKVSGWINVKVFDGEIVLCSRTDPISLLAHNEWCGLVALPEILTAFVLPNDPAVMKILDRASKLLLESTGSGALDGYQDKSRKRAWEQVAAIYKSIETLGIRYINPLASFETTGQKIRFPSEIVAQRFGTCLDLALLFAACCEQVGLNPLVLMHEGHAYAGCWLEERTLPEPSIDDLQHIRKLETDALVTIFETTAVTSETPSTLKTAELLAKPHLETELEFEAAIDVRRSRIACIRPLPVPGQAASKLISQNAPKPLQGGDIGTREFAKQIDPPQQTTTRPTTRIDQWKSRLLDLSLRNRLLNFKETKSTIHILSAAPEHVEDELAAERELSLRPKPKLMGETDPRNAVNYTKQQQADALSEHLHSELCQGRLHTHLDDAEHASRLTELYRAARNSFDENGTNTLFIAVGTLEWRETERSDRVFCAPLLLIPVELKRKSVLEGFSLRRIDEETRLNITLIEMLRQNFRKEIPGLDLDSLPEDDNGVNVTRVFQLFRDAVRDLVGWEVKSDVWLGQFSFTKFLLWKDLADRLDSLTRNSIVHHLVYEAGQTYSNPPEDIAPAQLDKKFHPREIFCPRSADSSQLAAIMAAAAGHNFVLEGPPGTGKSQTIANIIAHCLASGKRVLFVAEKRAALDVVHRRLREDGLEPFCLELHSNKIGKTEVLAQFERTLKFLSNNEAPDWERRATELNQLRTSLNGYTSALHKRYACGLSAFHCFDYLLPRQAEPTVRLDGWPTAIIHTSDDALTNARQLVQRLQERSRLVAPLIGHPLALLACDTWSPTWAEHTSDQIRDLRAFTQVAMTASHELRTWLHCTSTAATKSDLSNMSTLAECLLTPEPVGPAFATTPWFQLSANIDIWNDLAKKRAKLRSQLTPLHIHQASETAAVPCEAWTAEKAEALFAKALELITLTKNAIATTRDLRTWLQMPLPEASRFELARLIVFADSLLTAPAVAASFISTPWHEWVAEFDQWIVLVSERVELRVRLAGYDEALLLALDLDTLNRKRQMAQKAWLPLKWLRINSVRRGLRTARLDQVRPELNTLNDILQDALRLRAINAQLSAANPKADSLLGTIWAKGEPQVDQLTQVRAWGETFHEHMASLADGDIAWLKNLRKQLADLFKDGLASYRPGCTVGNRLSRYQLAVEKFDEAYEIFASAAALNREPWDLAPDHLVHVLSATSQFLLAAPHLRTINAELAAAAPTAEACLGSVWGRGEPQSNQLSQVRSWGQSLHASMVACAKGDLVWLGTLRQSLASLFLEGPTAYGAETDIGNRLARYRDSKFRFDEAFDSFASSVCLCRETIDGAGDHLADVLLLAERVTAAWPKIHLWCSWQKVRHDGMALGFVPLISMLESVEGRTLDLPALFERSFRQALLFAIMEQEPVLRDFLGQEHNERINRFRETDEKFALLTRGLICARLAAGIPNDQGNKDIPKDELGLLRKEIGKRMRHIPVRQLLNRIPKLLSRLKPCVLMSPLSVAQYLDASQENFDVVIFDEASQIPVWDAVGAIARGKQLIVVGDPKQLPPTNFFSSGGDDENEAVPEEYKDLESILDELMTIELRHKRLQWHYRSRHEGLIAFSNRQYYENSLLTFPSPDPAHGGVRFMHLPDARYDKGKSRTNRGEAVALVTELIVRLRSPNSSRRSYGVVTFSQAQQQLVENLLDEERRKYPEIEIHFGDEPPVEGEPVFVKNLENVQGDERDVIFFSICYGSDEAGKISMNFGPLNRNGGERRLNVAITRAKHEVLVFSGLRADQIDLSRTRSTGVRDLKYFLHYAENGLKALAATTTVSANADVDSEFEKMVANRIRAAGYEVHYQVGCSGYRIDLAVVDPMAPGRYLLGVECDGATYHSAATARDRDKLRQLVLEGLGWKLHRVWSTDWWHDADAETEKLIVRLAELQK